MSQIPPTEIAKHNQKIWGHTGWSVHDPLMNGNNAPSPAGKGKTIFIREGCSWCHTLLPEQTQDWAYFGAPPEAGDVQGESPSLFGSDRKAPDLLHIAQPQPREGLALRAPPQPARGDARLDHAGLRTPDR